MGTLDQVNISFSLLQLFYALLLLQLHDERTVIGKTLFKKETKIQAFLGLKVQLSTGSYIVNLSALPVLIPHCVSLRK